MRRIHILFCSALLVLGLGSTSLMAQETDNVSDLQKQLRDQVTLTKTTADRKEITTAGTVLVLKKDGLSMVSTDEAVPPLNLYKGGIISQSAAHELGSHFVHMMTKSTEDGVVPGMAHRKFVTGEKFWITAADVAPDGVVLTVLSDPFNDVRYYGKLKFPFKKGAVPPAGEMIKLIQEVIGVDAPPPVAEQPAPPPPPIQEIAPPPPPPAPPKTISIGQTKAVVVATWGQPTQIIKGATKEVYVYPDMKVVFVAGKVADVK